MKVMPDSSATGVVTDETQSNAGASFITLPQRDPAPSVVTPQSSYLTRRGLTTDQPAEPNPQQASSTAVATLEASQRSADFDPRDYQHLSV
jgi:hypothetical protein